MGLVTPTYLSNWVPGAIIPSAQVKAEFIKLFDVINGNLDSTNISNGAISTLKIADGAVTDAKISAVAAGKITGVLSDSQLPTNLVRTTGATFTGGLTFNVTAGTALMKNYDNEEIILYEGGTGADKIQLIVGGSTLFRLVKNSVVIWSIATDNTEIPTKFKVPVV